MRHKINRDRKVDERLKYRRHMPASRGYLHAMTNSQAKRYAKKTKKLQRGELALKSQGGIVWS